MKLLYHNELSYRTMLRNKGKSERRIVDFVSGFPKGSK